MNNAVIIETKAEKKNADSNALFESHGLTEQEACSKYCLGMHYLGKVKKTSHFDETIALMNSLAAADPMHKEHISVQSFRNA